MNFSLGKTLEILQQTPQTLTHLLGNLSNDWTTNNEGGETWSSYDVIGHLIHADKTNWLPKIEIILSNSTERKFESFDRFAQFENSKGKTLQQLLSEFNEVRKRSIIQLKQFTITEDDLTKTGIHPVFGEELHYRSYYLHGRCMTWIILYKLFVLWENNTKKQ
ncbi:DinB family protein [Ferruginibacter albus]|uniref:DinB family protein n=1 Tax=Ferruginibacter albus TaxID=2875540 RepID=UPI001CC3DCDB|nr:DinB family protein [Ferruginibacter albus]UAY52819.1 DinB family protein [Ferruginibacter albus]